VHDVLRAPGAPLDPGTRGLMERRLGIDVGRVRVHTDEQAAASARAVAALAYTVGRSIVFDRGRYAPHLAEGRSLLAHELVHTIQQGAAAPPASGQPLSIEPPGSAAEAEAHRVADAAARGPTAAAGTSVPQVVALRQRSGSAAGQRRLMRQHVEHFSGRQVGNVGPPGNMREDILDVMARLQRLWSLPVNAAVAAERAAVAALAAGATVPATTIPETIQALRQNQGGHLHREVLRHTLGIATATDNVGQGQNNARADVLALIALLNRNWYLSNTAATSEGAAVRGHAADLIPDALIAQTIAGITRLKREFVAGTYRMPDLMAVTRAVTLKAHGDVEKVLNPGATVTTTIVGGVSTSTTTLPAMTGGGPGGAYESKMVSALQALLKPMSDDLIQRQSGGQPGFPLARANPIAAAAQEVVEAYFAPYIRAASRQPGDLYHPGRFNLASVLGDQSTRPLSTSDLEGWMDYFMTLADYGIQAINDAHHPTPAEAVRVRDLFINANTAMVTNAIHSWPAEAGTGTVFLNPWRDPAPAAQRATRWDVFTILLHEMLHKLAHPNYTQVSQLLEDRAGKILREGMDDVMRRDLWDGPGNLVGRLASASMEPLRRRVEGAPMTYDATAIVYHADYDEIAQAREIVKAVGMPNAKAAYFLGRTELLGLGAGTHTPGGATLAPRSEWATTDEPDTDVYAVAPGDTLASIRNKTNAPLSGILAPGGTPVTADPVGAVGTRLRVPGIRWIRAIPGDTLASLARQSGVHVPELAEANNLPRSSPGTTAVIPGQRMLIPIHHIV
jgi:LysM repeat protein